mgnify:CR=1 FL=1
MAPVVTGYVCTLLAACSGLTTIRCDNVVSVGRMRRLKITQHKMADGYTSAPAKATSFYYLFVVSSFSFESASTFGHRLSNDGSVLTIAR